MPYIGLHYSTPFHSHPQPNPTQPNPTQPNPTQPNLACPSSYFACMHSFIHSSHPVPSWPTTPFSIVCAVGMYVSSIEFQMLLSFPSFSLHFIYVAYMYSKYVCVGVVCSCCDTSCLAWVRLVYFRSMRMEVSNRIRCSSPLFLFISSFCLLFSDTLY
jgi:hypothetical protein